MEPIITQADRKRIWQMRTIYLLHGMASAAMGFTVLFLQTKGLDAGTVGIVLGINAIVGVIAPPIWGLIADRIRSKYRVFLYTIICTSVVSLFVPISATIKIAGVILTTAMFPLLNFFRMPSQAVLDAATVSACAKVNGMDYSNIRMYMSAGFAVMNIVYSPLIAWFGIGFPYYALVGFTVLMFLSRKVLKTYETDTEESKEKNTGGLDLSRLYKNYYLVVFLVINVLMMIPMNAGMMLTYLIKEIGANTNNIGYITGVRVFAEIIALLLSARIKRVLSQPMMMVAASVLFLLEMMGYQIAGSFVTVGLTAMLGGAGFGLVLSTGYTYVNSLAPKGLEATAISLYSIGLSAAGVLTSFIGGQIVVHLGVRTLYFYSFFCVILWLIVFFASYFVGEKILKKPAPLPLFRRLKD